LNFEDQLPLIILRDYLEILDLCALQLDPCSKLIDSPVV
jgi:hypothetical protein